MYRSQAYETQLSQVKSQSGMVPKPNLEYGVASAMKELSEEIEHATQLADSLQSVIGISVPEEGQPPTARGALATDIRSLAELLRTANRKNSESLRHFNC